MLKKIIKVCGLKEPCNIQAVAKLGPDLLGFIFYPESKRFVSDIPQTVLAKLSIPKVAVTVNMEIAEVLKMIARYDFEYVQLSGDENLNYVKALKEKAPGLKLIKSFDGSCLKDSNYLAYEEMLSYYLFDNKQGAYGGTGKSFVWDSLVDYAGSKPYLLSGGIAPKMLDEVNEFLKAQPLCAGVDLNSGFEVSPGLKDVERLKYFMEKLQ